MAEAEETTPEAEELLHVALCREADDMRAMHRLIGVKVGEDPWVYWDTENNPMVPSAVESLLGACGFAGGAPKRRLVLTRTEEDVNCIPLFGFTLPRKQYASVRIAIQVAMSGQMGGFVPLIAALAGYHDTAIDVLSYVWTQTDRPPIWVRTPELADRGSGTSVPESLLPYAYGTVSIRNSAFLRGRGQ